MSSEKKTAILNLLSIEQSPIGLSELKEKLGSLFKERTLRRYLSNLVSEGIVEKVGAARTTRYQLKQQDIRETYGVDRAFSRKNLSAIEYVHRPLIERELCSYNQHWFDAYIPNKTFYVSKDILERLYKAGGQADHHDPAGTYAQKIYSRLLIDLSYNSSRLEGNTYSLLDTERLLLAGQGVDEKLEAEKVMILNHKEAIRYLVENATRLKVDTNTVLTLHFLLADGLLEPEYAGNVRDHPVRVTGSNYLPYEDPKLIREKLDAITRKASAISNPFEQSCFLLIHLSYLQAFSDVNKRTARLAANIPLILANHVPLSFNEVDRSDYLAAIIAIYELQEPGPLIDLLQASYLRTCKLYESTLESMGFDEVRIRYRKERRELIRMIIKQKLKGKNLKEYVFAKAQLLVPTDFSEQFIEDVHEDLKLLDHVRLAGLGVTPDEFDNWKTLSN